MQNFDRKKKLIVISGSSGVGKGTVIKSFLQKHPEFGLSVSCTTRAKREGEIEGKDYFYLSNQEFSQGIENNEFLEWAEFSGNYYGTKKSIVQKCLDEGRDLILEIDTQGAFQIKEKMPDSVLIFIYPPSYEDLEFRLRNRKTETEEAIAKRLDCVRREMKSSDKFDYKIVNDKIETAVEELEKIIETERDKCA